MRQIKQMIPKSLIRYHKQLQDKIEDETITPKEYSDLITLINFIENKNVERVYLMAELYKLRNQPFEEVVKELNPHR